MVKPGGFHIRVLLVCFLVSLGGQQFYAYMIRLFDEAHFARERLEVANELGVLRLRLEQELNSTFYVSRGLEMLIIGLTADGTNMEDHWDKITLWAAEASANIPSLINIGLSDQYVIRFSYPKKRNQKTIGVDYRELTGQFPAVERAVRTRMPVVAGPLQLIQGGTGILCRIPLFSERFTGGGNDFIGIVTMVIDYHSLLEQVGLLTAQKTLTLAIKGKDGLGEKGELFLGSEEVFEKEGVIQSIEFLGGEWVIAAKPIDGWSHESPYSTMLSRLSYLVCVLGTIVGYLAVIGLIQRRQAVMGFTRELELRVDERTQELSQAKDEAVKANRSKSEFLTVVTHELRTPLNSIIGLTDLILGMELGKKQRELLGKVSISAGLLLELINNILSFAKMESGKEELHVSAFSLREMLNKVANMFEVAAANKSISFETKLTPGTPELYMGDEAKISQVLINLCGNALKFTRSGSVTVTVSAVESYLTDDDSQMRVRFEVVDTGIGISEESQRLLFQPFSQVDSSLTRKYQGSGLGLSISRNFIELMNGAIGVDSTPGEGSHFWFEVPLASLEQVPDIVMKAEEVSVDDLIEKTREKLAGISVILAEDNEFNQILAISLLEKADINVAVANNGLEVLELLKDRTVHGILMDIQMPEMDGVTTTQAIRQEMGITDLPIIALTANALEEDREQVLSAGLNSFIAKPIKAADFYQALIRWFDRDKCVTYADIQ